MKAIGYIRVSTKDQGKYGTSLAYQEERIRIVCDEKGWDLIDIYSDSETGTNLNRDGFNKVMERISEWNILVITKPDRLSRNIGDNENLFKNIFEPLCKNVWSTEKSMNLTTNADVRVFTSAMASVEVRHINKRVVQGMHSTSHLGYWIGKAPMGYRTQTIGTAKDRKRLVPNDKGDTVRKIFELASIGIGLRKIGRELNMSHQRIKYILINPVYYGYRELHEDIVEKDTDGIITRNERVSKWVKHDYDIIVNKDILDKCWEIYEIEKTIL